MGLRETLNENPGLTTAATVVIVVAALAFVGMTFMRGGRDSGMPSNQTWFTDDDGQNYFAADRSKLPPFNHNGKEAVRAYLYTCDGGRNKFVGYMERYTPEAKQQLETIRSESGGIMPLEVEARLGVQVKKPGDTVWVLQTDPRAADVMDVKCPDGSDDNLELVPDP